jgi:hypothetical protein
VAHNEAGIAASLFLLGLKLSHLNKKLQPIKYSNIPQRRLQFFDLHTGTYLYEVKQKIEIIFA